MKSQRDSSKKAKHRLLAVQYRLQSLQIPLIMGQNKMAHKDRQSKSPS